MMAHCVRVMITGSAFQAIPVLSDTLFTEFFSYMLIKHPADTFPRLTPGVVALLDRDFPLFFTTSNPAEAPAVRRYPLQIMFVELHFNHPMKNPAALKAAGLILNRVLLGGLSPNNEIQGQPRGHLFIVIEIKLILQHDLLYRHCPLATLAGTEKFLSGQFNPCRTVKSST